MGRRLLPRMGDWIFILVFAASFLLGQRMLNTDADLGRHLALGGFMLDSRSIPVTDILSSTKFGASRPPYEWLAQLLFAMADRLLGLDGVVLLTATTIAAAFFLVYTDAVGRSGLPLFAMVITFVAAITSSLHWLLRPHVFSMLLLAIWVMELERLRAGQTARLWVLPAFMLVWANTHGGFVFGFLAWIAYMAGTCLAMLMGRIQPSIPGRLAQAGGLAALASLATPATWHNWTAVLQNRSPYILSRTAETMMPAASAPSTWLFIGLLVATAASLALPCLETPPSHTLLVAGFGIAAIFMARNIPMFAITAAPILASQLGRRLQKSRRYARLETGISTIEESLPGFIMPGLIVAFVVFGVAYRDRKAAADIFQYDSDKYPVAAAAWLKQHDIQGSMFNDLNWGGYLLYELWPKEKVFIDSQTDFYGESFTRQYADIFVAAPGWQNALGRFDVGWAILPSSSALAEQLALDTAWHSAYRDPTASIFVRDAQP